MPVVGLTVVISLLAGIALYQVLPWQQHEIATRVIMLVSLAAGLYSAYRVNRDSIVQLLQKKTCATSTANSTKNVGAQWPMAAHNFILFCAVSYFRSSALCSLHC